MVVIGDIRVYSGLNQLVLSFGSSQRILTRNAAVSMFYMSFLL